ncbi:MAG: HPr family phosphocarrier protein [Anaerolineaceae bacterium]|jgi:phosphocarrier protein|nr:MAG: HPr family phosphocarrier protein [Anaerolineaceae bacterium]
MRVETIIKHEIGLHARPAAMFVQSASKYQADICVTYNGKEANGKSLLSVLGLGITKNAPITIHAVGQDSQAALQELQALIDGNFGE